MMPHTKKTIIKIPSQKRLGINITAETFKRNNFTFDFPDFPKGKEYPRITYLEHKSDAYNAGMRLGDEIISLNGFSFFHKDISTVLSDFEYEKRSNDILTLLVRHG